NSTLPNKRTTGLARLFLRLAFQNDGRGRETDRDGHDDAEQFDPHGVPPLLRRKARGKSGAINAGTGEPFPAKRRVAGMVRKSLRKRIKFKPFAIKSGSRTANRPAAGAT